MYQYACEATGVEFISLDEIKGLEDYQYELYMTAYDKEENPHTVKHDGVSKHSNDNTMKRIAEKIHEET